MDDEHGKSSSGNSSNSTDINNETLQDSDLGASGTELAFKEWDQKMANYMNNKVDCILGPEDGETDLKNTSELLELGQKTIFALRHGERVDFTFGQWTPYCFDDQDNYTRKDLNMPIALPKRASGKDAYEHDGPLTMVGCLQARLTGEGLKEFPGKWIVFSSPSLRCIQTAAAFIDGLGLKDSLMIKIEPGLFEWVGWYRQTPTFMTTAELLNAEFNVDVNYEPYYKLTDPIFVGPKLEGLDEFYSRSARLTFRIAKDIKDEGANILLVGHSITLDTTYRGLRELPPRPAQTLGQVLRRVPFCSLLAMRGPPWEFVKTPCPPMMNTSNGRFNSKTLQL